MTEEVVRKLMEDYLPHPSWSDPEVRERLIQEARDD